MTQSSPLILINQLNYATSNLSILTDLSLTFASEKTGLIGRNGIGKSTLLKLIMGELCPKSGSIQVAGKLAYCPQQTIENDAATVADLLGIREKLVALERIRLGSTNELDFQIIGEDWLIKEDTSLRLTQFGLAELELDQPLKTLSGGEKTRLYLAKAFIANPDFILLDEPTNNLDKAARHLLYNAIANWSKGVLVVSHDRTLLNLMDQIIELTPKGIHTFGGNYDHYHAQKTLLKEANERALTDAKKTLQRTKASIQTSRERLSQRQSYGRNLLHSGRVDKMTADTQKWRSEKTQSRLVTQSGLLLKNAEQELKAAQAKMEPAAEIKVALPKTHVANGKVILEITNLTFSYQGHASPLIESFNWQLQGPERIALLGENGSGKTTLIKLILGELKPLRGHIYIGAKRISYLDQNTNSLEPEQSILNNFLRINPDAKPIEAHAALAQFLFRNVAAERLVKNLSGGEKLRAELACALMSTQPPELLILDEPTNHLDLESIASIESALRLYQGALIVISHDQRFLDNVLVSKSMKAPFTLS